MATIYIDNQPFEVSDDGNLLQACLSLGFDLPYFCWHPALGSVGACRQCAVKVFRDESDTRGRIYMACETQVREGMRISLEDAQVKEYHSQIIEWMMTNHPHDCPVCDEGGECHLQDMTVLSGHTLRRHRFPKRTFRNQDLGPFINHEMNRCITCYRCVRFYNDYAGGTDLQAMASKNHVYFGRFEDGPLESEFSGNLVEVCPTGVFTDKTLKQHYARKWDLQSAPSICIHCALGCNTLPGERYGTLRRIHNRFHSEINGYFLCDRGRFGYGFVNSDKRFRQPQRRDGEETVSLSRAEALQLADTLVRGKQVVGIGSSRASLESNAMLRRLVGAENFYAGVANSEWCCIEAVHRILTEGPARTPSLHEVEQADAVLVLGEDISQSAARLALSLRQASHQAKVRHAGSLDIPRWQDRAVRIAGHGIGIPIIIATPAPTGLDELASTLCRAAPDDIARLGFAIAHALDSQAPAVTDLSAGHALLAEQIAGQLAGAERPLIISGTTLGSQVLIEAAANIACALDHRGKKAGLSYTMAECDSLGLAMLKPQPMEQLEQQQADTLVVLENDLYRRAPRERIDSLMEKFEHVLVFDHLQTDTTEHAELVLPAATFAEASGTLVSSEARAQRFFQVFQPESPQVLASWHWLAEMMQEVSSLDQVLSQITAEFPTLAAISGAAPPADFRILGQRIPRQSARYSGRTAMHADQTVHEPAPPPDSDSPLTYSMEGYSGQPPPALLPRAWVPYWNSCQAINKFQQEVGGPLRGGDPGVRLIEPPAISGMPYFQTIPAPFESRTGQWLVVPRHHLFGSEELSLHTRALSERTPIGYIGIAAEDAAGLGIADSDIMELRIGGVRLHLPIAVTGGLPTGVLALPQLPGIPHLDIPGFGELGRPGDE